MNEVIKKELVDYLAATNKEIKDQEQVNLGFNICLKMFRDGTDLDYDNIKWKHGNMAAWFTELNRLNKDNEIIELYKTVNEEKVKNILIEKRMSGNSTRLADFHIQKLFENGRVEVKDHYKNGEIENANRFLFHTIMERLQREHPRNTFTFNTKDLKIEIKDFDIINNNER